MKGVQEIVFLDEIVLQAKIAQRAYERLQMTHSNFDKIEAWSSIQSILIASSNISKILWPNKKYSKRGESLRQILKIDNDNLLSNRKFRNHFEHYDERIEEWFIDSKSGSYFDLGMNPSLYQNHPSQFHRGYNSYNNTLLFRGEILDLNDLLSAINKLYNNCKNYTLA